MADLKVRTLPGAIYKHEMDSNETTGFVWSVESYGGLHCKLYYVPDDNPDCLDGVGGTQFVEVSADSAGKRTLVLLCSRSPDEIGSRLVMEVVTSPSPEARRVIAKPGEPARMELDSAGWEVIDADGLTWISSEADGLTVFTVEAADEGLHSLLAVRGDDAIEFVVDTRSCDTMNVDAEVRKQAVFDLRANITTGFAWEVVDDGGLRYSSRYVSNPNPKGMCGVGGRQHVALVADSPGVYKFSMSYRRSWEEGSGSNLMVTLNAKPAPQPVSVSMKSGKSEDVELACDPSGKTRWTVIDSGGIEWEDGGIVQGASELEGVQRFRARCASEGTFSSVLAYRRSDGVEVDRMRFEFQVGPSKKAFWKFGRSRGLT